MVDRVIADRFDNVLTKGRTLLSQHVVSGGATRRRVKSEPFAEWQAQSLALLESVFGAGQGYAQSFANATLYQSQLIGYPASVESGMGILQAAAEDLKQGWTWTFKERVHADLFDDFLDMANHLVADGYKDPAAVLAGGVLEEHLRKLCQKHGIATQVQGRPKKASAMNDELAKAPAYNRIEWRGVQEWLDLRNDAAHGNYANYARQQVEQMIDGIRGFVVRHPA